MIQSDGFSRDNPDDLIDLHVSAGTVYYLVVEGLGGAGSYTLTTKFTPSAQPFSPLEMTGPGADSPQLFTVGDFNGDGFSDIAASDGIHLGVGDGTFRAPSFDFGIPDDAGTVAMISGYFDGDNNLDLAIVNTASRDIAVLLGNGDGTFRSLAPDKAGAYYRTVTGDFDGDNKLDLAVADAISGDISVLLGNGDGTFQDPVPVGRGIYPTSLVTGDFDGDKVPDLAAANAFNFPETPWVFSADIFVLWGKGHGTFEDPVLVGEEAGLKSLVTGDFDGDNKLDLATADAISGDITVLLSSVNRTFKDPVLFRVGGISLPGLSISLSLPW